MVGYGRATVALTTRRYEHAIDSLLRTIGVTEVDDVDTAEVFIRHPVILHDLATALHLCGRDVEAETALEREGNDGFVLFRHYPDILRAVMRAAEGNHTRARQLLASAVADVRRAGVPLGPADCAIGAAALAYWAGEHEVASDTLSAVRHAGGSRTEASFALYRGYADRVKAALGDTRSRPPANEPLDEALDRILGRLGVSAE